MKPKNIPSRPMDRARVGRDDPPLGSITARVLRETLNVLRDPKYRIAMFESSDVLIIADEERPMNYKHPRGDKAILAIVWGASDYCPEEAV